MARWWGSALAALAACGAAAPSYPVTGRVVEVRSPTELVVAHEEIPGFMDRMIMPFTLEGEAAHTAVAEGDLIEARLVIHPGRSALDTLRVVGHVDPGPAAETADTSVRLGQPFPVTPVPVTGDEVWTLGAPDSPPTLVTFLYTTCPLPEFCPATVRRLQDVQRALAARSGDAPARMLAVSIDPEKEDLNLLARFAADVGADPSRWRFGRLDRDPLLALARAAGLTVREGEGGQIDHSLRWVVIGADGRLVDRYLDNDLDVDRVVGQLLGLR